LRYRHPVRRWVVLYLAIYYSLVAWAYVTLRRSEVLERVPGSLTVLAFGVAILFGILLALVFRPSRRPGDPENHPPDVRS
jgi:hypothetical protein